MMQFAISLLAIDWQPRNTNFHSYYNKKELIEHVIVGDGKAK